MGQNDDLPPSDDPVSSAANPGADGIEGAREFPDQVLKALNDGRFDRVEELLQRGDVGIAALTENLRVYQTKLQMQNEALLRSQQLEAQALARFTALFHAAPVAQLVVDWHGLIVEANPQARALFALRDLDAHHHFLPRLVEEADRGSFLTLFRELTRRAEGAGSCQELRLRTTEGTGFIGELHGARLPHSIDGEPRLLCAVIDRTEQIQQHRELRSAYDRLAETQEAYEVLARYSPDWDYWLGTDGRFVHVSPGCRELTGYDAEAFLGDPMLFERLLHPDDVARWREHLARHAGPQQAARGDRTLLELRLRHRDGSERWIEHDCRAVFSDDGRFLGTRGVNRDLTARRRMEHEVRELQEMLVDAERITDSGAWSWTRDDGHFRVSPGWMRIHGTERSIFSVQELVEGFAHPDDTDRIQQAMQTALAGAAAYDLEHRIVRADDGGTRWIHARAEALADDQGAPLKLHGTAVDITDQVDAHRALRESEQRYRALFESAAVGMLVLQHGRFAAANGTALRLLGHDSEDAVIGQQPWQLSPLHQPDGEASETKAEQLFRAAESGSRRFAWTYQRADGGTLPVEVTLIPLTLGGAPASFVTWFDLTLVEKARERELQAFTVFEHTAEAIIVTDPQQRVLIVNRAFTELTGFSEAEIAGEPLSVLDPNRHGLAFLDTLQQALEADGFWRGEVWNRRRDGTVFPALMTMSAVRDDHGTLKNYIVLFADLSQAKRSEEELYRLAHEDPLTSLANRSLLQLRMEQALRRAARNGHMAAVLFIDLDLFKHINDSLGHSIGDGLLKAVAAALQRAIGETDTLARIGGDEFVLLMEDVGEPDDAAHMALRLRDALARPFRIGERELWTTASIGVSLFPADGSDMDTLLRNADRAMFEAKEQGRNTYRFFEPQMTETVTIRLRVETALRAALERDELWLAYQPQFLIDGQQLCGAEVLLRWIHPELGAVSPQQFIPIAEEIGLIHEIGAWVLERACEQLAVWDVAGLALPRIAVNLSVQQLEREDLSERIRGILERAGVAPQRLELEVTESVLMRNADQVIANLERLRTLGVTLAVDDFGSGFSSLGYLKRLPINRLKIDKVFVDGVTQDGNDDAITRAIIALGQALGLEVMAEGVETEAQLRFLAGEGCREAQGYLLGRPMPPQALRACLRAAAPPATA